jgi:hypothetical protein
MSLLQDTNVSSRPMIDVSDEDCKSPFSDKEMEEWRNKRKAEKAALKSRVSELRKEIKKMPEWQELTRLKGEWDLARAVVRAMEETIESWMAEAENAEERAYDEFEEYRETKYLPALKAHPLGPEYIAARKRLDDELKYY